jgi:acyl-CoA dehydrogenase
MAWDFSTEPEFEEKLEWMRGFTRDEIIPLETLDLDAAAFERATAPLKQEVKARGLWAATSRPGLAAAVSGR